MEILRLIKDGFRGKPDFSSIYTEVLTVNNHTIKFEYPKKYWKSVITKIAFFSKTLILNRLSIYTRNMSIYSMLVILSGR